MKIELYIVPNDEEGSKLEDFLIKHSLPFHKIPTENISVLNKLAQCNLPNNISLLKITYSRSIGCKTSGQRLSHWKL
jgi:hypothetical protein